MQYILFVPLLHVINTSYLPTTFRSMSKPELVTNLISTSDQCFVGTNSCCLVCFIFLKDFRHFTLVFLKLFHRPLFCLDTSFTPPKLDKANTR